MVASKGWSRSYEGIWGLRLSEAISTLESRRRSRGRLWVRWKASGSYGGASIGLLALADTLGKPIRKPRIRPGRTYCGVVIYRAGKMLCWELEEARSETMEMVGAERDTASSVRVAGEGRCRSEV